MLDERTNAKITLLGSSYKDELLKLVDAENLPSFLGGTCECPGGCDNADIGPWNDGTTPGYPQPFWEDFEKRDNLRLDKNQSIEGLASSASSYHTANIDLAG